MPAFGWAMWWHGTVGRTCAAQVPAKLRSDPPDTCRTLGAVMAANMIDA